MKKNNNSNKNEFSVTYEFNWNDKMLKIIFKEYTMTVYQDGMFIQESYVKGRLWHHAKRFNIDNLDDYIKQLLFNINNIDPLKAMYYIDDAYWLNQLRQYLWLNK